MNEALAFLEKLKEGGTIVSSNDCSPYEISLARCCHRFFVDAQGFGYVYRPKKKEEKAHE